MKKLKMARGVTLTFEEGCNKYYIMIYAYCRVSTQHQKLARQITNITTIYPTATIIKEFYTGTKQDRPNWKIGRAHV